MKSRLVKLYSYKQVDLESEAVVEGVQKEINNLIRHIVKNYKKVLKADEISDGDVVTLKTESSHLKFNKNILPINVGRGLFDTEFENAVMGMKQDEIKTVTVKDIKVKVTVLDIRRTVYPELTDDMIAECSNELDEELSDVKTVDEFHSKAKKKHFKAIKESMIYVGVNNILAEMFENSEWAFDENEIKEYAKTVYEEEAELMSNEGIDLDSLESEADFIKAFGDIKSREELEEILVDTAKQTIAVALFCCEMFGLNPEEAVLDEKSSKSGDLVSFLYKYITDNVKFVEEA